jgi:hypothetical protein
LFEYFDNNRSALTRPVVAMGYSGGFMPLVEALANPVYNIYNVKTLVGLGAPTAYWKKDTLETLTMLIGYLTNQSIDLLQHALKSILGFEIAESTAIDAIQQYYQGKVVPIIKEAFQKTAQQMDPENTNFPFKLGPKTELIVNVWGSEDPFYKDFGVAGPRNNFLGKTTYNIEIKGANHFDYIKGISSSADPVWNQRVADFCTDLILNSDNETKLLDFFARNTDKILLDISRGVYVVRLPGWEAKQ